MINKIGLKIHCKQAVVLFLLTFSLNACWKGGSQDGPPNHYVDVSGIPDAIPKNLPKSRYGNPSSYTTMGRRYYVRDSAKGYEAKGIASWYGRKFHGQLTSSREPYDMLG